MRKFIQIFVVMKGYSMRVWRDCFMRYVGLLRVCALMCVAFLIAVESKASTQPTPTQPTPAQSAAPSISSNSSSSIDDSATNPRTQNPLDNTASSSNPNTLHTTSNTNPTTNIDTSTTSSEIDSSNLRRYSSATYRYNARFDAKNAIEILGLGGSVKRHSGVPSYFGGGVLKYDGLIDRYPLGLLVGYTYEAAQPTQNLTTQTAQTHLSLSQHIHAQNLTLGIYSDMFFDAHHISLFAAQSFQAFSTTNPNKWLFSSATNTTLAYGYVLPIRRSGSFFEPFARFSLHTIFPINQQESMLSAYALRSHLALGVAYKQFLGSKVLFSLSPAFMQDIGVIGADSAMRAIVVSPSGEMGFALNDKSYHSYGIASAELIYRASKAFHLAVKAHALYTQNLSVYVGNLTATILF